MHAGIGSLSGAFCLSRRAEQEGWASAPATECTRDGSAQESENTGHTSGLDTPVQDLRAPALPGPTAAAYLK